MSPLAPGLSAAEQAVQEEAVEALVDLGWVPRTPAEIAALREGRRGEVIVEPLLVDALIKINGIERSAAEHVASIVRRMTSDKEFLNALRGGINLKLDPAEPARDIRLIDLDDPDNNSFVVTWEFAIRTGGVREPRLDIVCLVNGLPLGLIENKAEDHDVMEAAQDWARYYDDAPQLEALGAVVACNNGIRYRVGPSGRRAIQQYAEWKDTWPHVSSDPTDEMTVGLTGTLHPHTLIDLAANFIVFETRDGVTTKKLARYQQFRAANKIVDRVVAGQLDRGLIWHTTGSGKSLTMVFAARKLMHAGLDRPTVFIVIDRTDLDDQLSGTFGAVDFDGLRRAETGEQLRSMIASDKRGVIVTIVNKFRAVQDAVAERENVIVFVDEAHRSQEGEFGIWMRAALPHARLFAFTGTPVETGERSTRRAFSPVVEQRPDGFEVYEQYLDVYSIKQSIEDGATVAVLYEPRLSEWQLEDVDLDAVFDREFSELSDEQREALRKDAAREAVVAKAPRRVNAITEDVVNVLRDKVAANGFKAQLVAVDREACVGYAEALGDHLLPDEYAVIISRDSKKDDDRLRSWWPKAALQRVRGEPVTHEPASDELSKTAAGHKDAVRQLIERFTNPEDPLRLLIVNAMLLTGFDAPVEQAMFLDRPLRRHTLLQAIARTNRTFPGKQHGLVFDYWGVLNDLNAALAEFDPDEVAQAATNTDALAAQFPAAITRALNCVADIPSGLNERRRMRWLVGHFAANPDAAAHFEEAFRSAVGIYETLAPDPRLAPHVQDYRRLVRLRAVWKHGSRQASFDVGPHRVKTHGLVHDAISNATLQRDLPVYRIDGDYLKRLNEDQLTPEEKAAEIDAAAVAETRSRGEHDPIARSLAERLRGLRERHARSNQMTLELLAEYEQAVEDYVEETEGAAASGLSERAHLLSVLSRAHAQAVDETTLNEVAQRIDARLREVADFHGWQDRADVLQAVRKVMISELAHNADTRALATSGYVDEAIAALVAAAE